MSNRASRRRNSNVRGNTPGQKHTPPKLSLLRSKPATWVLSIFAFCLALSGVLALSSGDSAQTRHNSSVSLSSLLFAKHYIPPTRSVPLVRRFLPKRQLASAIPLPYELPTQNTFSKLHRWHQADAATTLRPVSQ